MIEVYAVGGYTDVGKNCTAVKVNDEVVIIDLGVHLENYIKLTEDEDIVRMEAKELIGAGAVPDISKINPIKEKVRALVISHAHLDHLGAVPYISDEFNAPIIGTPFTTEVINTVLREDRIKLKNKIVTLSSNSSYKVSESITIEFVHITHSTPHTVLVAVHTNEGTVLYANDFKLDLNPTLGKTPNFKRIKELGNEGIAALIVESTYAGDAKKMPSESVAREMLKDVLLGTENKDNAIILTTFSSHIARLKSVVELGRKMGRKVVFLGRSLAKYTKAAEKVGLVNFSDEVRIVKYGKQAKKFLKKVGKNRNKYLLVMTGHQGEHQSILYRIAKGEIKFDLMPGDLVIFSCKTIPTPTNIQNRESLENDLKNHGIRIFKEIHQSGHAAREDLRDFISMTKPEKIIPAHGNNEMKSSLAGLAEDMGYKKGKNVIILKDGQKAPI